MHNIFLAEGCVASGNMLKPALDPRTSWEMNDVNGPTDGPIDTRYLEGLLGFQLRCAQLAVFRDIMASFGDIPVTLAQFSAMCVINDNGGITQAELASAIEVDRPRIVPVLDMMERRGWSERRTEARDRRVRRIYLTEEGQRVLLELQKRFDEHQDRLRDRLGDAQMSALMETLSKISQRQPDADDQGNPDLP